MMLKIDRDKLDQAMDQVLTTDKECINLLTQVKHSMNTADDSLINLLITTIYEVSYQRGLKDGIDFIISYKNNNLLY